MFGIFIGLALYFGGVVSAFRKMEYIMVDPDQEKLETGYVIIIGILSLFSWIMFISIRIAVFIKSFGANNDDFIDY